MVSWNYRGLEHFSKVNAAKYLIKSKNPDFLLLQENKLTKEQMISVIQKQNNFEGLVIVQEELREEFSQCGIKNLGT